MLAISANFEIKRVEKGSKNKEKKIFYTYLPTFLILNEADLARSGMLLFFVPPMEGAAMYCPGPGVTYCTHFSQCLNH